MLKAQDYVRYLMVSPEFIGILHMEKVKVLEVTGTTLNNQEPYVKGIEDIPITPRLNNRWEISIEMGYNGLYSLKPSSMENHFMIRYIFLVLVNQLYKLLKEYNIYQSIQVEYTISYEGIEQVIHYHF